MREQSAEPPTPNLAGDSTPNASKRVRKYDFINPLVGHRIRMLRNEKGISRSQVAKQIDKTLQQLDHLEGGQDNLTAEHIYKLCNFFSVEANYFFTDLAEINLDSSGIKINAHQAKELRRLFDSYLNLPNRDMQKSLVKLAESVAQSDMS